MAVLHRRGDPVGGATMDFGFARHVAAGGSTIDIVQIVSHSNNAPPLRYQTPTPKSWPISSCPTTLGADATPASV